MDGAARSARFSLCAFPSGRARGRDEGQRGRLAFLSSVLGANLRLYPDSARGRIGAARGPSVHFLGECYRLPRGAPPLFSPSHFPRPARNRSYGIDRGRSEREERNSAAISVPPRAQPRSEFSSSFLSQRRLARIGGFVSATYFAPLVSLLLIPVAPAFYSVPGKNGARSGDVIPRVLTWGLHRG